MAETFNYKQFIARCEIILSGNTPDIEYFKDIPKLSGPANWFQWKNRFSNALSSCGIVYVEILNNSIQTPPSYKMQLVIDEYAREEYYKRQHRRFPDSISMVKEPTLSEVKNFKQELGNKQQAAKEVADKALDYYSQMACRVLCFLYACVDSNCAYLIDFKRHPYDAYEALENTYGTPSRFEIVKKLRALTSLSYAGSDVYEYHRQFTARKMEYEEAKGELVDFDMERTLFLASLEEPYRCTLIDRAFESTNAMAMYREFFLVFQPVHQCGNLT